MFAVWCKWRVKCCALIWHVACPCHTAGKMNVQTANQRSRGSPHLCFLLWLSFVGLCGDKLLYNLSELKVWVYCRWNEATIYINESIFCFLLRFANADISLPFSVTLMPPSFSWLNLWLSAVSLFKLDKTQHFQTSLSLQWPPPQTVTNSNTMKFTA